MRFTQNLEWYDYERELAVEHNPREFNPKLIKVQISPDNYVYLTKDELYNFMCDIASVYVALGD